MRYMIYLILVFLVFFSGSSGEIPKELSCNCDTTLPQGIDTAKIKEHVQARIDSFTIKKLADIDQAVRRGIADSVQEFPKVRGRRLWLRWVDKDQRPNGHTYIWKWWYYINKTDTVWYRMEVQRIK